MKLKQLVLSTLMIFGLYLISCQKSIDSLIQLPVYSNYLDKMYDVYDIGSGLDTQFISTINYDNTKRVTSIIDSVLNGSNMEYYGSIVYSYNGSDTVPYKTDEKWKDVGGFGSADTTITFHFYDSQNKKTRDSSVKIHSNLSGTFYDKKIIVVNYSYSTGKLFGQTILTPVFPVGGSIELYRDTADLNSAGDITMNKKYVFNGTDYDLKGIANFTYDAFPNPFAKLSNFQSHREFPNGETLLLYECFSHTNRISQYEETYDNPNPPYIFSVSNTFTYNSDGYPVSATASGAYISTLYYKYKTL